MLIYQKINFIKNKYTRMKISIQSIVEIFTDLGVWEISEVLWIALIRMQLRSE